MADVEPQLLSETLEANKTANAFFDIERPQFLLRSFLKPPRLGIFQSEYFFFWILFGAENSRICLLGRDKTIRAEVGIDDIRSYRKLASRCQDF